MRGCPLPGIQVDLGVVFTFRWMPDSVAALPLPGTVNLHPTLLPAYRGPNGYRTRMPRRLLLRPGSPDDEAVLDLALTAHLSQCRTSALVLAGIQPSVTLNGERHPLRAARQLRRLTAQSAGIIRLTSRRAVVAAADGVLELGALPF